MTDGIFRVVLVAAVMSVFATSVVFGADTNAPAEPKPAVTVAGNVVKIVKDEDKSVPKYENTKYNAKLKDYNYDAVVAGAGIAKPIDGNIGEFLIEGIKLTMKEKKFKSGAIETEELGKVRILFSSDLASEGFIALLTDEQLRNLDKLVSEAVKAEEYKDVDPKELGFTWKGLRIRREFDAAGMSITSGTFDKFLCEGTELACTTNKIDTGIISTKEYGKIKVDMGRGMTVQLTQSQKEKLLKLNKPPETK